MFLHWKIEEINNVHYLVRANRVHVISYKIINRLIPLKEINKAETVFSLLSLSPVVCCVEVGFALVSELVVEGKFIPVDKGVPVDRGKLIPVVIACC